MDVESFGRQAETLGQYMKKGRPIMIEGRLRLDTWDDRPVRSSKLGVVMSHFSFWILEAVVPTSAAPVPGQACSRFRPRFGGVGRSGRAGGEATCPFECFRRARRSRRLRPVNFNSPYLYAKN